VVVPLDAHVPLAFDCPVVDVVVPLDAPEPFAFDWLPADVVVPLDAPEPLALDWLPVDVVAPLDAPELPELTWLLVFESHPLAVWPVDGLAVECFAAAAAAGFAHHLEDSAVAVAPEPLVAACVATDGFVLADVVDDVCVLDVPPFAVGWAVIAG
jgi:hypothetical protein